MSELRRAGIHDGYARVAAAASLLPPLDGPDVGRPGAHWEAPSPETVLAASRLLLDLYRLKNPTYGDSWCRRGAGSAHENVARKFDRLDIQYKANDPRRLDDVVDLALYSLLQVAFYLRQRPGEFCVWAERAGLLPQSPRTVVGELQAAADALYRDLQRAGLTSHEEDAIRSRLSDAAEAAGAAGEGPSA